MHSKTVDVLRTLAWRGAARRRLELGAAATGAGGKERVVVPIADGSEGIETCCITDTLVRAGAEVTVASVEATTTCTMSRGLKIVADALVTDLGNDEFDLVALPGGMPGGRGCATATRSTRSCGSRTRGERLWRRSARRQP